MSAARKKIMSTDIHPDFIARNPVHKEVQAWLGKFDTFLEKVMALHHLAGVPGSEMATTLALVTDRFTSSGRIVYSLGPKLHSSLREMKLSAILEEELLLPFEAFYLDFSKTNTDILVWGGPNTLWHPLKGAYVYAIPEGLAQDKDGEVLGPVIGIVLWGAANDKSVDSEDDAVYQFRIPYTELFSDNVEAYARARVDDEEWDSTEDYLRPSDAKIQRKRTKNLMLAMRLVFNTVLYITSDKPEVKIDARTRLRQETEAKLFRVGASKRGKIKRSLDKQTTCYIQALAPTMESSSEAFASFSASEGSEGVARHRVRAHWHRYWVSPTHEKYADSRVDHPEKMSRRLIRTFVPSYLRGTDLAGRVTSRVYKTE